MWIGRYKDDMERETGVSWGLVSCVKRRDSDASAGSEFILSEMAAGQCVSASDTTQGCRVLFMCRR